MCLGIPGRLLETFERDGLPYGRVDFGGIRKDICLAYTPEAVPGEYVLVHVGFAISRLDEVEAEENLRLIREIEGSLPSDPFQDDADRGAPGVESEGVALRQRAETEIDDGNRSRDGA
ncbi:MAG: HypC/HybG/HupF family hydrogenase formation chaperone [Thermogutta sp.]|nr:HypC/HybG/HupF family hydrogenase formation chaperone [Thermogutta sp.]